MRIQGVSAGHTQAEGSRGKQSTVDKQPWLQRQSLLLRLLLLLLLLLLLMTVW
eukprot:COSAG02_NODE_6999_length_3235_cov_90.955038_4_plen_53_part_00